MAPVLTLGELLALTPAESGPFKGIPTVIVRKMATEGMTFAQAKATVREGLVHAKEEAVKSYDKYIDMIDQLPTSIEIE